MRLVETVAKCTRRLTNNLLRKDEPKNDSLICDHRNWISQTATTVLLKNSLKKAATFSGLAFIQIAAFPGNFSKSSEAQILTGERLVIGLLTEFGDHSSWVLQTV